MDFICCAYRKFTSRDPCNCITKVKARVNSVSRCAHAVIRILMKKKKNTTEKGGETLPQLISIQVYIKSNIVAADWIETKRYRFFGAKIASFTSAASVNIGKKMHLRRLSKFICNKVFCLGGIEQVNKSNQLSVCDAYCHMPFCLHFCAFQCRNTTTTTNFNLFHFALITNSHGIELLWPNALNRLQTPIIQHRMHGNTLPKNTHTKILFGQFETQIMLCTKPLKIYIQ